MRKLIFAVALIFTLPTISFGQDLRLLGFSSPITNYCNFNDSVNVVATIFNAGATKAGGYSVSYSVNGVPVVTDVAGPSDSIASLGIYNFVMSVRSPLIATGTYSFFGDVDLAGDVNPGNDTLTKQVINSPEPSVDTIYPPIDTVCASSNSGTITVEGITGTVQRWEFSTDLTNWTQIPNLDTFQTYNNLSVTTYYRARIISGPCTPIFSDVATVEVSAITDAGTITGTGNVCSGSSGTLTLTGFSGTILDWESTQDSTGAWTSLSNTTTTQAYTNITTSDDTLFRAIVKLGVCPADTTPVGIITIDETTIGGIVSQSFGNDTVCAGANFGTLSLSGQRGTVTRWEKSELGGPFTDDGDPGSTTHNFTNLTVTTTYRALVQNGACPPIVSASFTIQVDSATIGGTINNDATVCSGTNGGTLNLIGERGTIIKWEFSTNGGGSWSDVLPLNTTSSLTYSNLTTTTLYRVQVKNGSCAQIPSASATITVNSPTVGGNVTNLGPATVCAGNNGDTLLYSGGNGSVVRWERKTISAGTWTNISNLTTSEVYNNLTDTTMYRVLVQNGVSCTQEYSDTAMINVLPASVAGSISGTSPVCAGDTVPLTLSGQDGTIVTWRVSTNGGATFSNVGGSAGQTNIDPIVSTNSLFQVIVQNGTCDPDTTVNFSVVADPASVGGTVTSDATECGGNNGATLNLAGNTGNVNDWLQSINSGATWTSVPGPPVTTTTYTYTNLTQSTLFRAEVQSGVCPVDSSSFATITVIPAGVGGIAEIVAPNDSICASTVTVTVQVTGNTGSVIGWEASENGGATYTAVPGASGTPESFNYTFTTNTLFRALVQSGASCDTVRSATAEMFVGSSSVGGTTAGTDTVCGGSNNGFVTVSGNVGDVIRWESSTNGGLTWTPEPNSDSVAYNYVGLNNTTLFRAIVQDVSCPQDISDTVEIVIIPAAIGGTVTYAGGNVCAGDNNVTLNLTGSSGIILRWEKSPDGTVWSSIPNTTTTLNDSDITATTHYRAVLQSGACPEVASVPDTIFVDPVSDAGVANGSTQHCDTGNAGQVFIVGYNGNVDGWIRSLNGGAFTPVASSNNDTISYTNLPAGTWRYRALVTSGVCDSDTSADVTIEVDPNVVGGTLTGGTSHCSLTNSTLLELQGYTNSVVIWQISTNGGATFTNMAGTAGRDTITFTNVAVSSQYRVIVSSGNGNCGTDTSTVASIDVGQSLGGTLSSSAAVCISGHTGLLQVTGTVGTIVEWQDSVSGGSWNNVIPSNAGVDTLRYTNLTATTSYRVLVQSAGCDTAFSTIATITVDDTVFAGQLGTNNFFCDTSNNDTILLTGYFGPIGNWQQSVDGGPFTDFSPVKTDSAHFIVNQKDSSIRYRVIMNGGVCGSDTSNTVEIRVGASLAGVLQSDTNVCLGNNRVVLRLSGYQGNILAWDSSTVTGIFAPTSHTGDSLVLIDVSDTITYRVRVQNPGCPTDTSNTATITVVPGTSAGILGSNRSHCVTTNNDSVILTGRSGTILLWESSVNMGATWDTVVGQTSDTLVYTNLTTTTMYRVIIAGAGICPNDTSNVVTIQIGPSDAGTIGGDTRLCSGETANLNVTGFTGSILTWLFSTDGTTFNPIPNSDTNVITQVVTTTSFFRTVVQSDTCDADTSVSYQIQVDLPFTGNLITPTTQLCYGIGSDTVFISQPVDSIIDWEFRADTSSMYTSTGNMNDFQTYSNLTITTHLRAIVKNGVCPNDTADITLTVDTFTVAGTITGDDTVCSGANTGLIDLSGFIGDGFNWQASTDGGNVWTAAPGATNDSFYVYNNLTDTTLFRVIVNSGGCPPDTSNSVLIVVKPSAIGGIVSSDTSFCKGPNNGTLTLSGQFGNIVNWQQSINGSGFTDVNPPITVDNFTYNNLDTTTSYRVIMSLGDCPNDTSTVATVTVLRTPVTTVTANGPTEFCDSGSVVLTATGGPAYSWSNGDTVASITVTTTGNYVVVVTDSATACADTDSMMVTAFPPTQVDAGSDVIIFQGQSTQLNATGAQSYEWSPKSGLSDGFIPNPMATPSDSTIYVVEGVDTNGCIGIDSVLIGVIPTDTVETQTEFTNLFTPNGDGINDTWNVTQLANCNQCKVAVYNRYGQEVFRDENYQNDWEGTFNGAKLPDGTYYYVISTELDKIYKGAITIMRGE